MTTARLGAMIYLGAVLAGIAGAAVGWFATGVVAGWIAGLCGMSDFEGGRGMFAFFAVGPIGGLLGMFAAAWTVLRRRFGPLPGGGLVLRLGGVLAGIAALVVAGIWLRLATLDTYTDRLPPQLEFELRMPAAMAAAGRQDVAVELDTDKNVADALLDDTWRDDGQMKVRAGRVSLDFRTTSRLLVLTMPQQPKRLFGLRLRRDPDGTAAFGDWRPPDFLDAGGPQPQRADAADPVALRYRVRVAGAEP